MLFDFGDGQTYDSLVYWYGEDEAFKRYERQWKKLVVATAKDDNTTRLFVRSIVTHTDVRLKEGWWNTFTITNKPCNKGMYICRIDDVRKDKSGYPIFVVTPIIPIDEAVLASREMTTMFKGSRLFVESYLDWSSYNIDYLGKKIAEIDDIDIRHMDHRDIERCATTLFINGKITQEQIVEWMNEPTDWEKEQKRFEEEVQRFLEQPDIKKAILYSAYKPELIAATSHPLFVAKYIKSDCCKSFFIDNKVRFVKDLYNSYECAVSGGNINPVDGDMWCAIESYLKFDEDRKAANKAKKTAAKKAKKAAAKLNNA